MIVVKKKTDCIGSGIGSGESTGRLGSEKNSSHNWSKFEFTISEYPEKNSPIDGRT